MGMVATRKRTNKINSGVLARWVTKLQIVFFFVDVNMWWGDRPLKPSIPKIIPRQIGVLRSELDIGLGVSCADREGVGDRAKHHCFSSSAYEMEGKCEGLNIASFARCFSACNFS